MAAAAPGQVSQPLQVGLSLPQDVAHGRRGLREDERLLHGGRAEEDARCAQGEVGEVKKAKDKRQLFLWVL